MKIYLASSFSLAPKVESVCEVLEDEGFEVICKWWTGLDYIPFEKKTLKEHAQEVNPDEFYSHPACKNAFERDLKGVEECDALVFVASSKIRPYCGANVEIGIAFAFDKPVYSIGIFKNSAMYFGITRCKDIQDVIIRLRCKS